MKQLSTLILATLIIGTATAQRGQRGTQGSVLNLQMMQHGQFEVVIDELLFNQVGNVLEVPNLMPGTHRIFISELLMGRGYRGQNSTTKRIVYNGTVNIPFNSVVFAHLDFNRQLRINSIEPLVVIPPQRQPLNDPYRKDDYGRGKGQGKGNGYGKGNGQHLPPVCSDASFHTLRGTLARTSFDRDKVIIASQFIRSNHVSSAQVLEIMRMLSFESSKLEFAKEAYAFCYDKQNYWMVNDGFSFNSSIRNLDLFIRNC